MSGVYVKEIRIYLGLFQRHISDIRRYTNRNDSFVSNRNYTRTAVGLYIHELVCAGLCSCTNVHEALIMIWAWYGVIISNGLSYCLIQSKRKWRFLRIKINAFTTIIPHVTSVCQNHLNWLSMSSLVILSLFRVYIYSVCPDITALIPFFWTVKLVSIRDLAQKLETWLASSCWYATEQNCDT